MIYLSETEIQGLLDINDCLVAVEEAYHAVGLQQAFMFPRQNLKMPGKHSYKVLSGALPSLGVMGTLDYSGGFPRHQSPFECRKLITLFSAQTGEPLACIESEYLSWLRTGATAGIAAKYLASTRTDKVAVLGSGRQARSSLMALHAVGKLQEAYVFSPTPKNREKYAAEMNALLHIPVIPVGTALEAVKGAQVVITATKSRQPVFMGKWWEPGMTIIALGSHDPDRRELDGETMQQADLVVVDEEKQALLEEGEILMARQEGLLPASSEIIGLGKVVAAKHPGRCHLNEKVVFLSGGIALEYLAVALFAYKKSKELKLE